MKARAGKKAVVLELGGNAAALVEDFRGDDELDAIISKITFGAFYQSGQSCISLQRLMVRQVHGVPSFSHQPGAVPLLIKPEDVFGTKRPERIWHSKTCVGVDVHYPSKP